MLVALAMLRSSLFGSWLSWIGIAAADGIFVGPLEQAGFAPAADIVTIGYIAWAIWLVLNEIFLLRS